ncbi:hypothetical protein PR048_000874, partial [Dryococelus australis]
MAVKGEACHVCTMLKGRLTVSLWANRNCTDKLQPLIARNFQNHRYFPIIESLPMKYHILEYFLCTLDYAMGAHRRKIILFIDNHTKN